MSNAQVQPLTVDELLVQAEDRPGRHDLVDGQLYAMAPERVAHAETKFAVQVALKQAIGQAGLPCRMLPDGMTVRINRNTAFEPDALVYCGPRLPGDAIEVPDPVIVVEVLSPSTSGYDKAGKLAGYFDLPGLGHYLIVDPDQRLVIHHRRDGEAIATRILRAGPLLLDPPGLAVTVEAMIGSD